jgi:hypothetical protein
LHRWPGRGEAVATARTVCEGALLVKLNADEALLLTGESDPLRAPEAVTRLGCRLALVTLGPNGAVLSVQTRTVCATSGSADLKSPRDGVWSTGFPRLSLERGIGSRRAEVATWVQFPGVYVSTWHAARRLT